MKKYYILWSIIGLLIVGWAIWYAPIAHQKRWEAHEKWKDEQWAKLKANSGDCPEWSADLQNKADVVCIGF